MYKDQATLKSSCSRRSLGLWMCQANTKLYFRGQHWLFLNYSISLYSSSVFIHTNAAIDTAPGEMRPDNVVVKSSTFNSKDLG